MKYILILLITLSIIACNDAPKEQKQSKPVTEVDDELDNTSKKVLDMIRQSVAADNDSLLMNNLMSFKNQMSEFINSGQLQNANDLRVAVLNYLDETPEVAMMVKDNEILAAEVYSMLQLPEIKEASLPSFAISLNDAGVVVEEQTVKRIEDKLEEDKEKQKLEENPNTSDQIVSDEHVQQEQPANPPETL